jgi:hydroxymethylpyrimidine pyrophosphatase-like HAD family hydrolase
MKKLMICVDFDGSIVEHRFPAIGEPLPGAFDTLRALQEAGHRLILWTCREDYGHSISQQYLTDATNFCEKHGIIFDAVNESIKEEEFRPDGVLQRKPYAHYYIDDAIVGGFPGWDTIREFFFGEDGLSNNESG